MSFWGYFLEYTKHQKILKQADKTQNNVSSAGFRDTNTAEHAKFCFDENLLFNCEIAVSQILNFYFLYTYDKVIF